MSKILVIGDCYQCRYFSGHYFDDGVAHCHEAGRPVANSDVVPDWCPLPDFEEEFDDASVGMDYDSDITDEQRAIFNDDTKFRDIPTGFKKALVVQFEAEITSRPIADMHDFLCRLNALDDEMLINERSILLHKCD